MELETPVEQGVVEDGEELVVKLTDETPEEEKVEQVEAAPEDQAKAEPEAPVAPAQGLEDLQKQAETRDRERMRLSEANRRLAEENQRLQRDATAYQARGFTAEEALIEAQLERCNTTTEAAKREYQAAMEMADYGKAAEAQQRIAEAASDKRMFEQSKHYLAAQRYAVAQPQQVPSDPIDAAIQRYSPTTQPWLKAHPEVFRPDGSLKKVVHDAHEVALDEGLQVDTPAYFSRVEQLLDGKLTPRAERPEPKAEVKAEPRVEQKQRRPVAAPVTRSAAPGTSGPGPNGEFRLTAKMRALAEASGAPHDISYSDWAREYLRGVKSGEIQPIE
jgi:hypothetical protein